MFRSLSRRYAFPVSGAQVSSKDDIVQFLLSKVSVIGMAVEDRHPQTNTMTVVKGPIATSGIHVTDHNVYSEREKYSSRCHINSDEK